MGGLGSGEEGELGGGKEAEGEAVVGGGAVGGDGGAVVGGGVTFVDGPVVGGVFVVEVAHDFVTVGLGEDGGCGDVAVAAVSFDECLPGDVAPRVEFVAVDDDRCGGLPPVGTGYNRAGMGIGARTEGVEGAVHSGDGGAEDVDFVYFPGGAGGYGPGDGFALDDGAQGFAPGFGDLFGVVEPRVGEVVGEDDGGGHYGACEASSAGFVAAGFAVSGGMEGEQVGRIEGGGKIGRIGKYGSFGGRGSPGRIPDRAGEGLRNFPRKVGLRPKGRPGGIKGES